jgi:hypothetical protein
MDTDTEHSACRPYCLPPHPRLSPASLSLKQGISSLTFLLWIWLCPTSPGMPQPHFLFILQHLGSLHCWSIPVHVLPGITRKTFISILAHPLHIMVLEPTRSHNSQWHSCHVWVLSAENTSPSSLAYTAILTVITGIFNVLSVGISVLWY